jgi:2-polyprenyl-3-methyl-5-hydroxy-6-metoxy-1,4-benzoquinol methylase
MNNFKNIDNCYACGSEKLHKFCSLGEQPLANNLKNAVEESDELYPLEVNVCMNCYHSQLTIAVDREALYRHYLYVSGTSNTLSEEFSKVASIIHDEHPGAGKKILDIACNDGTFLKAFRPYNWELHGIDPAKNIVESVSDEDLKLHCDFFPSTLIDSQYDVITCFNVVAHIPDPLEFLKNCKDILNKNGTIYVQTSQKNMIKNGEFDTIYHEHHSFFNINSMNELCKRAGLSLVDVCFRPVHGISYLFKIKHKAENTEITLDKREERINNLIAGEKYTLDPETYEEFSFKVQKNKERLNNIINESKLKVVGYGAAAKGVVMSNFFQLKHAYIIDDNPLKIGKVIGGVNIPIVSSEVLQSEKDDLLIIVYAWNFFEEIKNKIKSIRPNNNDQIVKSME